MKHIFFVVSVMFFIILGGQTIHAVNIELTDIEELQHIEDIQKLVDLKIIHGYSDGTFRPDEIVTRGQYIAFLSRALNLPKGESNFKDLPKGAALYEDVSRAFTAGIVKGSIDGYVNVNQPVTREEAAVMTDRALTYLLNFEISPDFVFADQSDIGTYAVASIQRMNALKIIGSHNDRFEPKKKVKRIDAAVYLSQFVDFTSKHKDLAVDGIPVLLYHHLLKDEENTNKSNKMIITSEQFEEQMEVLHEHGYETITLQELYQYINNEIPLPAKSVVITFDDGLKSNFEYAYPILKKYGFKANIFLITRWIRNEASEWNPLSKHHQYLSWEEVEHGSDVFHYGSHTHMLHSLNGDRKSYLVAYPKERVVEDLKQSASLIDSEFLTFAYPFGQYTADTKDILKELNVKMAFSTKHGRVLPNDDPYELKRLYVYPYTTIDQFKRLVGIE
ncbi:S-layer homology domain-containing protein [Bacillaceae bacterium W0354]